MSWSTYGERAKSTLKYNAPDTSTEKRVSISQPAHIAKEPASKITREDFKDYDFEYNFLIGRGKSVLASHRNMWSTSASNTGFQITREIADHGLEQLGRVYESLEELYVANGGVMGVGYQGSFERPVAVGMGVNGKSEWRFTIGQNHAEGFQIIIDRNNSGKGWTTQGSFTIPKNPSPDRHTSGSALNVTGRILAHGLIDVLGKER